MLSDFRVKKVKWNQLKKYESKCVLVKEFLFHSEGDSVTLPIYSTVPMRRHSVGKNSYHISPQWFYETYCELFLLFAITNSLNENCNADIQSGSE